VYAHNSGGWSQASSVWHHTTESGGGGGGGCPYVSTWNGDGLSAENNIIPQSEYPGNGGTYVTDSYLLANPPKLDGGQYVITISEFEHHRSYFDNFRLMAIDHSQSTQIAVLQDGSIIQYASPYQLDNSVTPDGLDLTQLNNFDRAVLAVQPGQSISLSFKNIMTEFAQAGGSAQGGVILGGWMARSGISVSSCCGDKKMVAGKIGSGQIMSSKPTTFTFRERPSLVYVPIEKLDDNLSIRFTENVALDYVNFGVTMSSDYTTHDLELLSAGHSGKGDVSQSLQKNDGSSVSMQPGESIDLRYRSIPLAAGSQRDFVLVTRGVYEKINGLSQHDAPTEFQLMQNYPNPFNPSTTITYGLTENSYVTLKIYDVLGQEVMRLRDGYEEAGFKTLDVDASNLPTGIYFYRLEAGKNVETKKMIIAK